MMRAASSTMGIAQQVAEASGQLFGGHRAKVYCSSGSSGRGRRRGHHGPVKAVIDLVISAASPRITPFRPSRLPGREP